MLGQRTGQALLLLEAGDGRLCPLETAPCVAPPSPTPPSSRESLGSSEFLLLPQLSLASLSRFYLSPHGTSYGRRVRVPDCPQRAVARESGPRGRAQSVATDRCPPTVVAAVAVARLARQVELAVSPADVAPRHAARARADEKHPARGLFDLCRRWAHAWPVHLVEWVTEETTIRQPSKLPCRRRKRVLTFEPLFTERGKAAKCFSSRDIVSGR